jgi:hypothetical protein
VVDQGAGQHWPQSICAGLDRISKRAMFAKNNLLDICRKRPNTQRVELPYSEEGLPVPTSVLDAIKLGWWDFEPEDLATNDFDATEALPGSQAKVDVLAERARLGLPLWHRRDRVDCEGLAAEQLPHA